MKHRVRIFEGVPNHDHDGDLAPVVRLPVAPVPNEDPAPHPVYSLDGLMALALAVSRLEVSG